MMDLKERNGLALAAIGVGCMPMLTRPGMYTIAIDPTGQPAAASRHRIIQGAVERSQFGETGWPNALDALAFAGSALGLKPVEDAPAGDVAPKATTIAGLQEMVRATAQRHYPRLLSQNPVRIHAVMGSMLFEEAGAFVGATRQHPSVHTALTEMLALTALGPEIHGRMDAEVADRAAAVLFWVLMLAERTGADMARIVQALPDAMARRLS